MATKITNVSKIPYNSPGIYFTETDLTAVTQATGGFSAAAIALTEKGPAFEITNSATYEDRASRLGGLNPKFAGSYFAKQYLEQSRNFKEVRILGLEGYKDTVGYAITLSGTGSTAANITDPVNPTALVIGPQGLAAILKHRPTAVTGYANVTSVKVQPATYTDPLTGSSVTSATDYLFNLLITYEQPAGGGAISPDTVTVSLRPESPDFIVKKFGRDPLDTPLIKTNIAPLWVDFVIPSVKAKPNADLPTAYYIPGTTVGYNYLTVTTGETVFGTTFTFSHATIAAVNPTSSKVSLSIASDVTAWLANGNAIQITGVTGTGNITAVNGTWKVANVVFASGHTTFDLRTVDLNADLTNIINTSVFSGSSSAMIAKYIIPTWENEVLDFSAVGYTTPVTPWIVSDGTNNNDYKRLFRFWSISDGKSANTEIKVEIRNMNPAGNNGNGTFDIVVRQWDDRDDIAPIRYETFGNLTMDPQSQNYILRRIGNSEDFELKSRYMFIEMNTDEALAPNLLPYGCLGYPNTTGTKIMDMPWTIDYDKFKPSAKQTLGLASNKINMNREVAPDMLALKNSVNKVGLGFHLNPNNNTSFVTATASTFTFANQTAYTDSLGAQVSQAEKVKRSKFVVHFSGGFDGFNVYSVRAWNDQTSADFAAFSKAVDLLRDKESIDSDFTVLVTPDINIEEHPSAAELVLDMVNERGDCLYIPDLAYDVAADPVAAVDSIVSSNMRSNSVAMYFPWLQIEDTINKINKWVPPSLLALGTIAYTSTNENVWQPPGGSIRTVTNNLIRTRRRLKLDDREILLHANLNPITYFAGSGYEIAGVRTTQEIFSALSFVHNRLLLCYAKKILNQTLRPLLMSLNNNLTQDAFINTVRPVFARIKKLNGLSDYKVEVIDKDGADRTTIYGRVTIVPLYPVERIAIEFQVQDGAITFNG